VGTARREKGRKAPIPINTESEQVKQLTACHSIVKLAPPLNELSEIGLVM